MATSVVSLVAEVVLLLLASFSITIAFLDPAPTTRGDLTGDVDSKCPVKDSGLVRAPISVSKFSYMHRMDANYTLEWDFNTTHINFRTTVKAKGYVAFGISLRGSMVPSDVIVGGVRNGKPYFSDNYITDYMPPIRDTQQDWYLISASETGDSTIITMGRRLDTCDSRHDIPVVAREMPLIYAYTFTDTANDATPLPYHGHTNRGVRRINLLSPSASDKKPSSK